MSIHTSLHIDESAKSFTFQRSQDVEDIIEANKQAAALPQAGMSRAFPTSSSSSG